MLKQLSKLEKTRNGLILAFVAVLALSMVLLYAPSRNAEGESLARSQETVASVGGETITVGELATQQENITKQYAQYAQFGNQFTPPVKTILNGEISNRMLRLEAARLGLLASDDEVAANIREQLKAGGMDPKNQEAYRRAVTENAGSVEKFEQSVRDALTREKLTAYLTSGVQVSETEVADDFKRRNTTFDLVYVPVSSQTLAATLKPTDAELQTYFDANKQSYYISSPQKKIRYLFINQAKVGEKLDIPEADLRAEYDALAPDKKQKGVEAQQIVLKVPNPELEAQVSEKAATLVQQARKDNGKISQEDFANLARGNSQDPATAGNGGALRALVRQNLNNPDDPYQKVLTLQPGEVTDAIKSGNNYYILRRGEAVPKSFDDARQELLVSLRNRRAYKAAADLAQRAAARLKEVNDVQKVAEEFAAQANLSASEMVRETGYVKPNDDVPNIGVAPQFEAGIAPLETVGQVGEPTPVKEGFAIPVLVDKKEPRDAELAEVKDQVAAAVKIEQAKTRLEQVAKDIAANANSPEALKAAAEKYGLKASDSKSYKAGTPLGEAGAGASSAAIDDAILNLKAGEITKTPIKSGDSYFIAGAQTRTEANMDEFAKDRESLVGTALTTKKNQIFTDYLASLRQRFEKEGRLKIYQDALPKLHKKPAPGEDS